MFFSLDAKVICIQVCRLAWDVFCFFVFIRAPWDEKLQWSELIYLCCLWSLLCLLLLMLSVTVGAATLQLHVATCYLTAKESDVIRSCSPSWCCSFALTHLKKLILWTCLKVFFLIHLKHASYCRLGHPNLKAPSMQSSRSWFIFSHNDSHSKKSLFERRQKF